MGLALPLTAAGRRFNALPVMILTFCLLWSSAFAAAKLTLAYSPPLLLLAARFLLAKSALIENASPHRENDMIRKNQSRGVSR